MKTLFDIPEAVVLSPSCIKVLDGIAGAGKSFAIDDFLRNRPDPIDYIRMTSTNKLKREFSEKYPAPVYTIASGLFTTKNGAFYVEEKEIPAGSVVVVDEVLQTSPKVFDMIQNSTGINWIICTDRNQLLAPQGAKTMARKYAEFLKDSRVVFKNLTYSYRPVTDDTRRIYNFLFSHIDSPVNFYQDFGDKFKHCEYNQIEFNSNDFYICHNNRIEEKLYLDLDLYNITDKDLLIQKGHIAGKDLEKLNVEKYSVCCQNKVTKKSAGYFQLKNVGSTTRFQGSEVPAGHRLFFIVDRRHTFVSNREFYTAVTRCRDIRDFYICFIDLDFSDRSTLFNKTIIKQAQYKIEGKDPELDKQIEEGRTFLETSREIYLAAEKKISDMYERKEIDRLVYAAYSFAGVFYKGHPVKVREEDEDVRRKQLEYYEEIKEAKRKSKFQQVRTFLASEPLVNYRDDLVAFYNAWGSQDCNAVNFHTDDMIRCQCRYGVDLSSSFPFILATAELPKAGTFRAGIHGAYDVYRVTEDGKDLRAGAFISSKVLKLLEYMTGEPIPAVFVGSFDIMQGCKYGAKTVERIQRSEKNKAGAKILTWGEIARRFIVTELDDCVVTSENYHEILYYAIYNEQLYRILTIMHMLKDKIAGAISCDACYFNYNNEEDLINMAQVIYGLYGYKFKLFENKESEKDKTKILYKTPFFRGEC